MNDRIKLLRQNLDMKQEDFGKKINLTKFAISNYENGRTGIPERVINDICREFSVNENWLRTGTGGDENMFIPEDMKYFQNVGKLGNEKNEFKKFYLNMMMGLPDEFWEYVYKEFKKFEEKEGE
ncbi:MAG: helix-turn-helix domain-containing protein [Hungatella sp.]|uniref:helix-turn-helix domain-containing protein n=1 Tax=Hungatella sp. TaxID=2613924 RepID=UPI0039A30F70